MTERLDANVDPARSPWTFRCFVWFVLTLAGGIIGPFATYTVFGFGERLVYWAVICAVAVALGVVVREIAERRWEADTLPTDLRVTALQASTIAPVVWLMNHDFYGLSVWGIASFVEHLAAVLVSGLLVTVLREQFRATREGDNGVAAAPEGPEAEERPLPEFLSLIEDLKRGPIKLVSADYHYLYVVTTNGSSRILMRFRDALAQLSDLPGYRIHRSHWVTAQQLLHVRPVGRRYVAELRCGLQLPVSRAYLDDLRRAGYLD